jgi:hypothetical protein|tara:strand:+ start:1242 stop:1361 length:120 start_codon:yes stop_codon:yes gene_type:complete
MEIIFTTLLATIGIFLVAGIIIEVIEKFFSMKERFVDED